MLRLAVGMQSIWGASDSDLYFATGGQIFHWDGATTTALPVTARRVTGDLLAYDGAAWTKVHSGVPAGGLLAIDASHVVVSSLGQSLLARWDGTAWNVEDIASGTTMPVLFQPPGGALLAGGLGGLVQHP